jgi:hypothetical protein
LDSFEPRSRDPKATGCLAGLLWQPVELIVASEHGNFQHSGYALSRPDGKEHEPGLWMLQPRTTKAEDPEPILIICRPLGFMIALGLYLQVDRQSVAGTKATEL